MVRNIIHDPFLLSRKSEKATPADLNIAADLLDTLKANADDCVGMAANMIGELKCIIVFASETGYMTMLNPVIIKKNGEYEAEEGCLSLSGVRKVKRYRSIKVQYCDLSLKQHISSFSGWTAQIIQHETDHCNGVLI